MTVSRAHPTPATAADLAEHRRWMIGLAVAVALAVPAGLGAFHGVAVVPDNNRIEKLEDADRRRSERETQFLLRLQRLDFKVGRVGTVLDRLERRSR